MTLRHNRAARAVFGLAGKVTERKLNVEREFRQARREAQAAALIQQGLYRAKC
jgi:hypothetical protein